MKVIVDTSVWSLFLRRKRNVELPEVGILKAAIREKRIQMLGIIRQELLSGIKDKEKSEKLRDLLNGFPDLTSTTEDHVQAAIFFNECRANGVQGSPIDFLICAQAFRNKMSILTLDKDFRKYPKYIPISLER